MTARRPAGGSARSIGGRAFTGRAARDDQETRLQIAAVNLLRLALPADAVLHHSHNEGKRSKRDASLARAMGQRAGFADLVIFWQREVYFIEFKRPDGGGRQERSQKEFQDDMAATGFERYAIARSIEDVEAALRSWGVPLKIVGNARGSTRGFATDTE